MDEVKSIMAKQGQTADLLASGNGMKAASSRRPTAQEELVSST